MPLNQINYFSHPTTVMLIDDNPSFLDNLSLNLDDKFPIAPFSNPEQALVTLNHNQARIKENKQFMYIINNDDDDSCEINKKFNINISSFSQKVFDPNRFAEFSIILVDYCMPQMTGIEFCRQLQDVPIKKIMVTGEADHRLAVNAFNEGVIDKFIVKDPSTICDEVNKAINEAQHEYFHPAQHNLFYPLNNLLTNKKFTTAFYNLIKTHNISEYYLLDRSGSFLLLDYDGNPFWLATLTDDDLDKFYAIARDNKASLALLDALQHRNKIPFFSCQADHNLPLSRWQEILYPRTDFCDLPSHHFALISTNDFFLKRNKPTSHREYLKKLSNLSCALFA